MFAYAPDGTKIVGTLEEQTGQCDIVAGTFSHDEHGAIDCQYGGYTEWGDAQATVVRDGERIFVDEAGDEWPESQVILREAELGADEQLDPSEIPAPYEERTIATYTIGRPEGGVRALSSFSADEKRKLRPIAETLAMLDGNSFFGITQDAHGDDTHYEQYLPEAAALVATTSGCDLASFMRDGAYPTWFAPVEEHEGERIINFVDGPDRQLVRVTDIDWDTSSDDEDEAASDADTRTPILPTSLIAAVALDVDPGDAMADLLSDRYGFCIKSLFIEPIAPVEPIELEETVGEVDGRPQWSLCEPGGGDIVLDLSDHIAPERQEQIAKAIARAFAPAVPPAS